MLARIAQELYWLGRSLARAEFTARVVDGVFRVELQGQPEQGAPGVVLGWNELLAMFGSGEAGRGLLRLEALHRLTLDAETPNSMASNVERARAAARNVRDVISADMWEAINTTALTLRGDTSGAWQGPTGPYLACKYVKERTALIGGLTDRTMLRDEAQLFLSAGSHIETADMVLRMLRVAFPPGGDASAGGHALALLHAVGGFQAYRRAVPAPPNARPVARFLLFERAYPDSVAASVDSLHDALETADTSPRNSDPVLRLSRLAADLDFQRRTLSDDAEIGSTCEAVQVELARVDADIAEHYFAGAVLGSATTAV